MPHYHSPLKTKINLHYTFIHTDSARKWQGTQSVTSRNTNQWMLFTEVIAAYCEDHTRHIYILWARCWASSVKPGRAHTNHLVSSHRPNHKGIWGCSGIAPIILNLGTRWMWVVKSTPRPLHHRRKNASTHRTGGWVAPEAVQTFRKREKS
jgi:hypothetical protein